MTDDDRYREALRALAEVDAAREAHLAQIHALALRRRGIVENMVYLASKSGERAPQAYVAAKLGVTQQRISKILSGRD
jgi:DNA-directed RNA polymerase specialized sigma subunit